MPRAIAFEIYRPVTPAKAGVQRAQNEDNDLETADFRHWIPAFAGMTVAESAGLMSYRLKCDYPVIMPISQTGNGGDVSTSHEVSVP